MLCIDAASSRRNFFLAMAEEGMNTNDYVYILLHNQRTGFKDTASSAAGYQ